MEYTEEQKKNILNIYSSIGEYEKIEALRNAKKFLEDTDYIANKIIEYQILGKELEQDYTYILKEREEARKVIRKYESEGDINDKR